MATVYDWSPVTGALNNQIDQWGQRNQVNSLIDSMGQGGAASNINPQMLQALRRAPPQVSLPLLLQLGTQQRKYSNRPEYDQQGRAFVMDDQGNPKYLDGISAPPDMGVADGVAYDKRAVKPGQQVGMPKAPQTREINIGDKVVTEQWDGQKFVKVAEAPRYKPASAVDIRENWGQPVTEAGPDGKPIVVRYSNTGGRQVVDGAAPKPQSRAPGTRMVDSLIKAGTSLENLERITTTFKPEYAGNYIMGGAENFLRRNKPGGDPSGQAQWWQDYQGYVNQTRNDLFGAALTPGEKAEFEKFIITPRMSPEESKKNLDRQKQISTRAAQRQAKAYTALGYDREAIEGALGYGLDDLAARETPLANPQAAPANGGWSIKLKAQ
jgi:hypothetical protein